MQGLDAGSQKSLEQGHKLLQKVFVRVPNYTDIIILDAQRDRAAQEKAVREGHSKVHFGESAHNYFPALAFDVVPDGDPRLAVRKIDWNNYRPFINLALIIYRVAAEEGVPLTWGYDWDGDGRHDDQRFNDLPHWQLGHGATGWKAYIKDVKLIGAK